MNIYQDVENMLMEAFNAVLGPEDIIKIDQDLINVEPPRDKGHGDVATNVAMVFAKKLSINPRDLAIKICNELGRNDNVSSVEVAGPGFINIKLVDEVWFKSLHFILKAGKDYGSVALGTGKKITVNELLKLICKLTNLDFKKAIQILPSHSGDVFGTYAHTEKMIKIYKPKVSLKYGLLNIIKDVKKFKKSKI